MFYIDQFTVVKNLVKWMRDNNKKFENSEDLRDHTKTFSQPFSNSITVLLYVF